MTLAEIRAYSASVREKLQDVGKFLENAQSRRVESAPEREELAASLEELSVVEAELREQIDELETTRIALEAERLRYLDLFEHAPDAYFVTDRYGTIREANAAAGQLLNVPSSYLLDKPLINFVARADCRMFRGLLSAIGAQQLVERFDLRLRPRHGGAVFRVAVSARVIRGLGDAGVGVRWIVRPAEPEDPARQT